MKVLKCPLPFHYTNLDVEFWKVHSKCTMFFGFETRSNYWGSILPILTLYGKYLISDSNGSNVERWSHIFLVNKLFMKKNMDEQNSITVSK